MLEGWLTDGLPATSVYVQDPFPSDGVKASGVHVNAALPAAPAIVLIAVKPQMMADALPVLKAMGVSDERSFSSLRFSFGALTGEGDGEQAADLVIKAARRCREPMTPGGVRVMS